MGNRLVAVHRQVAALSGWIMGYWTILLYRLGWDPCILAVIGSWRWLLCSGGSLLRFHCIGYFYCQAKRGY